MFAIMCWKDANEMANTVHPDQMTPSGGHCSKFTLFTQLTILILINVPALINATIFFWGGGGGIMLY